MTSSDHSSADLPQHHRGQRVHPLFCSDDPSLKKLSGEGENEKSKHTQQTICDSSMHAARCIESECK
eukprot:scaffold2259_cov140-Skeletonema_dohrnii-CCMP3373.AAC.5